ncbi:hypothetical protein DVS28_a4007 [Euzebya pacifica]|uniref:Uncharacterized protein n=1 Tax=Euzebya pacifica TaxID=1608957 RepID=A0A346Y2H9_9ACTN|nr:hypothetical protein DVS28_a4007 [Euzebya pacifica]
MSPRWHATNQATLYFYFTDLTSDPMPLSVGRDGPEPWP